MFNLLCLFTGLCALAPVQALTKAHHHHHSTVKTYGNSSVEWEHCGKLGKHRLECATIYVPMDHFAAHANRSLNFSIPLVRMMTKKGRETILINPGGPGQSGLDLLTSDGESLSTIIGDEFHLLAFDPRASGVGASRPLASCYLPTPADCTDDLKKALGPLTPTDDATTNIQSNSGDYFSWNYSYAKACVEVTGQHTPHINTPQTAADMNDILKSIGQTDMNYLGYSYGTVLGATYAQMYPDRVKRMVLDGVLDFRRYYTDTWITNEVDTDAVWQGLLEECFKAKSTCPLAANFSSVQEMRLNLTRTIDRLKDDPMPVYLNASAYGTLRDIDLRKEGIFRRLYEPIRWPLMAISLHALIQGDYETPYKHFFGGILPGPDRTRPTSSKHSDRMMIQQDNSMDIIKYSDAAPKDQATRVKLTRKEIVSAYKPLPAYLIHDANDQQGFLDNAWLYGKAHAFVPSQRVNTAHPVLFLSATLDPVTPLDEAKEMREIFEGSVLVEQKSMGHTTSSMPSRCTAMHIRKYFNKGILPPAGLQCGIDRPYFPDPKDPNWIVLSKEDAELSTALLNLAKDLSPRANPASYHKSRR